MKKLGIIVGLCLVIAQAGAVSAKSLEDVLKEKGVITEDDYKEVMKSAPVKYKLGEGMTLTSADGNFSTTIGGYVQARYTFQDPDDSGANGTTVPFRTGSSTFEVKRAKLFVAGHAYSKDITYNLMANFSNIAGGSTKNGGLLENAWINYKWRDELQVRAGQEKVQFGRQWLVSSTDLQFVDVSHVTTAFAPTYDTGVRLHGKIAEGLFTYSVAGSGGLGQNYVRNTPNNAFSARITANPSGEMKNSEADIEGTPNPLLSLGASFYRNTMSASNEAYLNSTSQSLGYLKNNAGWYTLNHRFNVQGEDIDFNMFALDAAFKWRGLSLTGEYMGGQAETSQSNFKQRAVGFYAQAGYMIVPKTVELAYRYAYLDPNKDMVNDHWIENSVGVSWYIRQHFLKLQADYTSIHKQSALVASNPSSATQPIDDNQARIQLQLVF